MNEHVVNLKQYGNSFYIECDDCLKKDKRIAELEEELKEAKKYETLAKIRSGDYVELTNNNN